MPRDLKRTDDSLLDALNRNFGNFPSLQAYLASCADAAIFSVGDRRRGFKPAGADVGEDGDPDAVEAPLHWNFITATAISKVGLQIQRELLEERTISYLIEWCDTPDIRCAGVAFTDISVMYDVDGNHVKLAKKSPDHNLYLMVPRPLLDPVLVEAQQELLLFYSQTFWSNVVVFKCFQAAIALAMRGENIDRCFIGVSPGGVGQSLYSGHLAAMFGTLHTFFDPNIWYHDDELRTSLRYLICPTGAKAHSRPISLCLWLQCNFSWVVKFWSVYISNSCNSYSSQSVQCNLLPLNNSSSQEASGPVRWVCDPYRPGGTGDKPSHEGRPV